MNLINIQFPYNQSVTNVGAQEAYASDFLLEGEGGGRK